jgi:hypothetical protein
MMAMFLKSEGVMVSEKPVNMWGLRWARKLRHQFILARWGGLRA